MMRIYVDTSVLGGCFDDEFAEYSRRFVEFVLSSRIAMVISDIVVGEVLKGPDHVGGLLDEILEAGCERTNRSHAVNDLRNAYLAAGVLTGKSANDALHVAHATLAGVDAIASWNFRHLVNPARVRAFNIVNAARGYPPVIIMTPEDIVKGLELCVGSAGNGEKPFSIVELLVVFGVDFLRDNRSIVR